MDKAKIAAVLVAAALTSASFFVGRSMAFGIPSESPLVYSQHFTEIEDDASNCCGITTYYTNGVAEVLVIKPTIQPSP